MKKPPAVEGNEALADVPWDNDDDSIDEELNQADTSNISRCNLHADIIITDWWKQVQKYVAQTITRLRNDRNTAMKWAVVGNCHSML